MKFEYNKNGTTKPHDCNWDDLSSINWDGIEFLFHRSVFRVDDKGNGYNVMVIKRFDSIPQLSGWIPIVAYLKNLKRYILDFDNGDELIASLNRGELWDYAMTLARGGEITFKITLTTVEKTYVD